MAPCLRGDAQGLGDLRAGGGGRGLERACGARHLPNPPLLAGEGAGSGYFIATCGAGAGAPIAIVLGVTGMPGKNTFCTPCTITLSVGARPELTTRRPSTMRPSTTSLRVAAFFGPST